MKSRVGFVLVLCIFCSAEIFIELCFRFLNSLKSQRLIDHIYLRYLPVCIMELCLRNLHCGELSK